MCAARIQSRTLGRGDPDIIFKLRVWPAPTYLQISTCVLWFSIFSWRAFKPQKLLLVGGFKIQLVVEMQYPWVLHFDNKLCFEASQKKTFSRFEAVPEKTWKIWNKVRNPLLRGKMPNRHREAESGRSSAGVVESRRHRISAFIGEDETIGVRYVQQRRRSLLRHRAASSAFFKPSSTTRFSRSFEIFRDGFKIVYHL